MSYSVRCNLRLLAIHFTTTMCEYLESLKIISDAQLVTAARQPTHLSLRPLSVLLHACP